MWSFWSFWSFVKIENGKSKSTTIIIKIYIFIIIVNKMTTSEIENDQNDLDQNDHLTSTVVCNVEKQSEAHVSQML